jgi:hypothetical protein
VLTRCAASFAAVEESGFDVRLQCEGAPATPLPADEAEPLLPAEPRHIKARLRKLFAALFSCAAAHAGLYRSCLCLT